MSYHPIIGHSRIKKFFQRAIQEGRLGQSFLFYGPEGVGKFTFALELAKALQCKEQKGEPCYICKSCRKAESGNHPDILVFGPEKGKTTISLEVIYQIQEQVSLTPLEGSFRVAILDDAHLMGIEAANSFLKILEEPYEKVKFILVSPTCSALLPTILSRCQKIPFSPLKPEEIAQYLEKKGMDKEKALLFGRSSQGSLKQALLYSTQSYLEIRDGLLEILINRDSSNGHQMSQKLIHLASLGSKESRRLSVQQVIQIWITLLRDLVVLHQGQSLLIHEDQRKKLEVLEGMPLEERLFLLEKGYEYKRHLERNYSVDIVLEQWIWDLASSHCPS